MCIFIVINYMLIPLFYGMSYRQLYSTIEIYNHIFPVEQMFAV
uniref:Uncharacterized protein n=1 Tax=Schistosoma curassoni TaxID=6186 RepID=A0A183JL46_9TREM